MPLADPERVDLVVVGGGAAGLHTALRAAEAGGKVCLVSRKPLSESSSFWAQGGLAAAIGRDDSAELHSADTITAGRASSRRSAAELLATEAPGVIAELERRGVEFDREADGLISLGLEGGHSRRRIVHAGGASTGRQVTERLAELAGEHPLISVREGASALCLLTDDDGACAGILSDQGPVLARATAFATGGAAALWSRTTNPWGAIGAGAVIAAAAGAELADLELCQFHPTALTAPGERWDGTLLTEAIRGEGAPLLDVNGERFTNELAPRDTVTLAILERMEQTGSDHVLLDMRKLDPGRFPNVLERMRETGRDPMNEPVPVSPAAHYVMGGIATDLDGRSSLRGLFAVGECACTGLHGANRLASNSLTECFVVGARVAAAALSDDSGPAGEPRDAGWRFTPPGAETREAVWALAGPKRSTADLERLLGDPYPLAAGIARFALAREESRGSHQRVEFPRSDPALNDRHLICPSGGSPEWRTWS